ncbi:MAG: glycosyltransferase [Chloroflexi bacterium]|nr:glycosyltransferase [Chloroflexota bacterium]
MATNSLVSIVLATYNGSRYLDESIQSCISQTYPDWELIIVDDASTDDTPAIIARWQSQDNRIRSIRHTSNQKQPAALNTGFAQARGAYLTWTSDDNAFRPQALQQMVAILEAHADISFTYTAHTLIDAAGTPIGLVPPDPYECLVFYCCIGPCFLYRRTVYEKIGDYTVDPDLVYVVDYDYWLRAAVHFRFQPIQDDLYLFRVHASSQSSLHAARITISSVYALLRHLPEIRWVTQADRARAYLLAGIKLYESGIPLEGMKYICSAITEHQILRHDSAFAVEHITYDAPGHVRSGHQIQELLFALPVNYPGVPALQHQVWGIYHGVRCFEGYQMRQRVIIRRHFLLALRYRPTWIGNRGLLRIALWAYTGWKIPRRLTQHRSRI